MANFVMVVNGEVAGNFATLDPTKVEGPLKESTEKLIAILSSNPTMVPSDERIPEGHYWDGVQFVAP